MFDAEYFKTHLPTQFEELGEATATVHLHGEDIFQIRRVASAECGYVLLEVYPPEGVTDEDKAKRCKQGGTDDVFYDRVAINYQSISYIVLSVVEPERPSMIGFRAK